jgi:hypothetical protein
MPQPRFLAGLAGFIRMPAAIAAPIGAGIATDCGILPLGKRTPAILLGAVLSFPAIVFPSPALSPSAGEARMRWALAIVR